MSCTEGHENRIEELGQELDDLQYRFDQLTEEKEGLERDVARLTDKIDTAVEEIEETLRGLNK